MTFDARVRTVEAIDATVCVDAYNTISPVALASGQRQQYPRALEHSKVILLLRRRRSHRQPLRPLPDTAPPHEEGQDRRHQKPSQRRTGDGARRHTPLGRLDELADQLRTVDARLLGEFASLVLGAVANARRGAVLGASIVFTGKDECARELSTCTTFQHTAHGVGPWDSVTDRSRPRLHARP